MNKIKLSSYSKTFYYEWKLDSQSSSYNMVTDQVLQGNLDINRLCVAIKRFISEHLLVNSHIQAINEEIYWVKNNYITKPEYIKKRLTNSQLMEYVAKPFDLEQGPLYRFLLIKQPKQTHRFIVVLHHILIDGLSANEGFFNSLTHYYNDITYKAKYTENEQYQLINKLSNKLAETVNSNLTAYKQFWQTSLANLEPINLRSFKITHKNIQDSSSKISPIKEMRFQFNQGEIEKIRFLAKRYLTTTFLFGQIVFAYLLSRYTSQSNIGISFPVAIKEGINFIYGAQINTNIMPYKFTKNDTIIDIFNQINAFIKSLKANSLNHKYCPIAEIIRVSNNSLLDIGFIQTNLKNTEFKFNNTKTIKIHNQFNIDLTNKLVFEQEVTAETINYRVKYNSLEIDGKLLVGFINNYKRLFKEILNDLINGLTDKKLINYSLLSVKDYKKIIYHYNKTEINYLQDKTIHQLFEEQVAKTPNNIALIYEDITLTYQELNCKANQLAHYLKQEYQIKPDDLIALCLNRSQYMLITILAVLKAGGAYVPLDPDYPHQRIAHILEDTKAKTLLINQIHEIKIKGLIKAQKIINIKTLVIDNKLVQAKLLYQNVINPQTTTTANNLAYVIYTSGTTGKPKGVMIEHKGVINRIQWMNSTYPLTQLDRILQKTPYIFDVSVWELLWANWYGACIVLAKPGGHKDINYLVDCIYKHQISIIHFVPSMLSVFEDNIETTLTNNMNNKLASIKHVFCSGEVLPLDKVIKCHKILPFAKIHNLYGPTEASIDTLYFDCTQPNLDFIGIGKPIHNTQAYILDENLAPLPTGVVGELHIGGIGLARGYLNQPALTSSKFIVNPFQTKQDKRQEKNPRLYKTGDLVRWLPDGNLEYIGRSDSQVKICGYRIELHEIESILNSYKDIQQSVVIAVESKNNVRSIAGVKYLVGYYVAQNNIKEKEILEYLAQYLPEYMLPSALIHLKKMPLTINGKLDKSALPHPKLINSNSYIAPQGEEEKTICSIFAAILGLNLDEVGIKDNFFKLGGDSILAIRLVNKLNTAFQSQIKVKDILSQNTIKDIFNLIKQTNKKIDNEYQAYSLVNKSDYATIIKDFNLIEDIYPASYLQMGMLIEAALDKPTYHDVFSYTLKANFDKAKLVKVWKQLTQKHELLRAAFITNNENGYNIVIHKDVPIILKVYQNQNVHELINQERLNEFDYTKAGLFRIIINNYIDKFDFIFSFHHAIADGWSIASLISEFIELYVLDKSITPLPKINYAEFIQQEQLALSSQEKIDYWQKNLFNNEILKVQWNFAGSTHKELSIASFTLNTKEVKRMHKITNSQGISTDIVFLLAYLRTLSFFTNNSDITIGLAINNRLEKDGGDQQFGLFLNTLPYRFNLESLNNILSNDLLSLFKHKLELQNYKQIPYGYIKSLFGQELYNFAFNFIHFHIMKSSQKYIECFNCFEKTNIPLVLNIWQKDELNFEIFLVGHGNFISQDYLDYFIGYYKKCVHNILNKSTSTLSLSKEDYKTIIYDYNATKKYFPKNKTIHQLFEEQVKRTPDNIALVYKNIKITYQELNQKANQLAHYLMKTYRIKIGDLIALCLNRNEHMLISILAVLKLGGAYVPIEPSYPNERINYILKDTQTKVLITNQIYQDNFRQIIVQLDLFTDSNNNTITKNKSILYGIVVIDNDKLQVIFNEESANNPQVLVNNHDLAYVIYTSGTTGQPKGVMIEHKGIVNLITAQSKEIGFQTIHSQTSSRSMIKSCLWYASYAFDAHIWDLYATLSKGHTVNMIDDDIRYDTNLLYEYIKNYNISVATIPPSLLNLTKTLKLEILVVAGEQSKQKVLNQYINNKVKVINAYGPSEGSVCVSLNHYTENSGVNNIGKPLPNVKCYVLDKTLSPLPVGSVGELYVGGVGLARGYLNNSKLNKEKFFPNPFQTKKEKVNNENDRLYKTGDLIRRLPDGNLEYIGRNDLQVKIRSHRIELGEIENTLNKHPEVKQSVVVALNHKENPSDKYLVGYYVRNINIEDADAKTHIENWNVLYDIEYSKLNLKNYKENINGWKSSYTGKCINKKDMLEWKVETVKRIKKLSFKVVLEIGSGSGLLLFNLVDNCKHYYATDFSAKVIGYTEKVVSHYGYKSKVTPIQCKADEIPFKSFKEKYDTVILNSVVQYFPTIDYLETVLSKVIENMDIAGKIFLGDIRDYRLLECFYYSVLKFKNNKANIPEIDHFMHRDKELVISPEYFIHLQKTNSYISHVEILPKAGKAINEMNCYRFDVILHVNKTNNHNRCKYIDNSSFMQILDIKKFLANYSEDYIYIKYPNQRIAKDYNECRALYQKGAELNNINEILNLSELNKTLNQQNYKAKFYLDALNPLFINIIAYKKNIKKREEVIIKYSNLSMSKLNMSNNPVHNTKQLEHQHSSEIKSYLESRLPSYMVPSYLILLDKLPLTINGKLDRKALPHPESNISDNYTPPHNPLEAKLCELFAQVIGLPIIKVGIKDDFFKIGGNSILAIKLVTEINNVFNRQLKIADIFTNKTVEKLSQLLIAPKSNFKLISHLNDTSNKLNLFMIHPGFSGAEIYVPLARKLANSYSCYGLDHYNLQQQQKITDLHQLASFYLSAIDEVRRETRQINEPYLLLGWSLGGQISLEIANILEQKGQQNIQIVLIDTILPDNRFSYHLSKVKINKSLLHEFSIEQGFAEEYVGKVMSNFDYDINLSQQIINAQFKHTQILLFKAMQKEALKFLQNYNSLKDYTIKLTYNNIDKITSLANIKLIKLENSNHFNLLEQNELISNNICSWHIAKAI